MQVGDGCYFTVNNGPPNVLDKLTNNPLKILSADIAMSTKIRENHAETASVVSLGLLSQRSEF
jgi:RNase adaptor protein for sRNA GlmZ degradation